MLHLKAIYFVRPTKENIDLIKKEIKDPRFAEYYINFTNHIFNQDLEALAEIDENNYIKSI